MANIEEENPLWALGLMYSPSGMDRDSYSKAGYSQNGLNVSAETAKGLGMTPDEYARLQAFYSAQLNNDITANLGFTGQQTANKNYKTQMASPRAGVTLGGMLDVGMGADVNRFAGFGMSDASPSMVYDARAMLPVAGGMLGAGGEYSTQDGPTYIADYGRDLGGGRLSASVSRNPKYDQTMALINWMKRF